MNRPTFDKMVSRLSSIVKTVRIVNFTENNCNGLAYVLLEWSNSIH